MELQLVWRLATHIHGSEERQVRVREQTGLGKGVCTCHKIR